VATALITGVTGQDGSYLADLLLSKGYRVVGAIRSDSPGDMSRIAHCLDHIEIVRADLASQDEVLALIRTYRPDEVYNLAARASSSQLSEQPLLTARANALAVVCLLEALRVAQPAARFLQASSSEIFGNARESPQSEETPFRPRNAYGIAKLYGHWSTVNYREQYGLFACSGILFNHESPRRGLEFVTRKITSAAARIKCQLQAQLHIGNLEARRDWGYAPDYVDAMWRMLQMQQADDYVLATGQTHSVRELCEIAFGCVGLDYQDYVVQDSGSVRPPEPIELVGNPAKARQRLQWTPTVSFREMISLMVEADLRNVRGEP